MPKSQLAANMYYRQVGDGPAVVFIHGFPEDGTLWNHFLAEFPNNTLIIPDLPGVGQSLLDGFTSIDKMAELLRTVVVGAGLSAVVLVGHSMGGYVALSFARQFPSLVAGISLVHSTPLADDDEKVRNRQRAIELMRSGGKHAFLKQMIPALFAPAFSEANPAVIANQLTRAQSVNVDSLVNFYSAMMQRQEHVDTITSSSYPVQFILGAQDSLIPVKKILPYTHASNVNFVSLYRDCGHMSMLETPDALIHDLKTFIAYCYTQ